MRWLILLHRYLGLAFGWLIALWCLSGIVMMYVPYPSVDFREYLAALPTLSFDGCCRADRAPNDAPDERIGDFSIEMLLGEPTLSRSSPFGRSSRVQLVSGNAVGPISEQQALEIAAERTSHWPTGGEPSYLGSVERDQWTVGYYQPGQTLHHIALNDAAGTEWYLDDIDGELVQATTQRERFWNWVGSVAHWLYPTQLRQHGRLWSNVVIYGTVLGLLLTVLGLYIGFVRFLRRPADRVSPYRGLALWHHLLGLLLGLVTLTWLLSGLLSMNPWGLLIPSGARMEIENLQSHQVTRRELDRLMDRLGQSALPPDTRYLESAPLQGRLYLMAYDVTGQGQRLDARTLAPARLTEAELLAAASVLRTDAAVRSAALIYEDDAYYYAHHSERSLPVYRIVYDDIEDTRYYLDADSGQLLAKIDATQRSYRWLFNALHQLDFNVLLRWRPLWDAIMVILLAAVTAVSVTGLYLGIRNLRA